MSELLHWGESWYFSLAAAVLILAVVVQLFYYLFFFVRIAFWKNRIQPQRHLPVSVVICARNEEENLQNYLPSVLSQDYPKYEVVVVNDCSEDETEPVLKRMSIEYFGKLRYTTIRKDDKFTHGKKLAMTVGIKAAEYEHIVFTDADCQPVGKDWLQKMVSGFESGKEIVIGYGGFERKPGLLNKWIRFDGMMIALQYLTFAMAKIPYMGVGKSGLYKILVF